MNGGSGLLGQTSLQLGNRFDTSKIFIASSYAVLYTAKSFAEFIRAIRADFFICWSASAAGL